MVFLFSTGFEQNLFSSILVVWAFSEIIGGIAIPKLRSRGETIKRKDNRSSRLLYLSLYLSGAIPVILARFNIGMLPNWFFYLGIFFMVLGIFIRQWGILSLGRFFTVNVSVQENQKIVDSGPYRFIRHPTYLGILLILIGIGAALQTWGGILIVIIVFGLTIGYRIQIEEKFLISRIWR